MKSKLIITSENEALNIIHANLHWNRFHITLLWCQIMYQKTELINTHWSFCPSYLSRVLHIKGQGLVEVAHSIQLEQILIIIQLWSQWNILHFANNMQYFYPSLITVTPIWSSSSGTIKRLVRFAKLTIVVLWWLSNMSLTER